jgi:hypothetical protein
MFNNLFNNIYKPNRWEVEPFNQTEYYLIVIVAHLLRTCDK